MKSIGIAILLWAGCTFACGLLLRIMWVIFMAGWSIV